MYDSDEYFLDEMPAEDVDWNDEFTEMAETLRDSLEDDYGATTQQMQEALLDVFDSLSPAESFNLGKALSQIEKGASSAIRDPTIGQLARTALPLAGGAVGTLVGGTARNSCGQPRRPGGRPSPSGVKPSKADGRDSTGCSRRGERVVVLLQGLVLTQKPEVLKSLSPSPSASMAANRSTASRSGAVLSLLSSVFGQAAADADELLYLARWRVGGRAGRRLRGGPDLAGRPGPGALRRSRRYRVRGARRGRGLVNGNRSLTLDTLVDRVMVDPMSFIERILQEVLDQLDRDGVFADSDSNNKPEQLVATAILDATSPESSRPRPRRAEGASPVKATAVETSPAASDGPGVEVALIDDYEQLVERNGDLVVPLGACDCWGKQPSCPICDGEGAPGWLPPDKALFTAGQCTPQ